MRQQDTTWEDDVREHFEDILVTVERKHPGTQEFWKALCSEYGTPADTFVDLYSAKTEEVARTLKEQADHKLAFSAVLEPLHALQRIRGAALPGQGKFIRTVQDTLGKTGNGA